MKKVSIIMPVYNVGKMLEKAIKSAIDQTYQNIEIIVVNDGSTDNSLDIINRLAKTDDRIQVIDKKNGGLSSARNAGIEKATGEYIYFFDSDDYIEKDLLEKTIDKMEEKNLDMGWFNYIREDMDGNGILRSKFANYEVELEKDNITDFFVDEFFGFHIGYEAWCRIYRHEIIERYHLRFNEEIRFAEDLEFNFIYIFYSKKIACLSEKALYHYVEREESIMGQLNRKIRLNEETRSMYNCYVFCEKNNYKEMQKEFYKMFLQQMGRYYDSVLEQKDSTIQMLYEETKKIEDKVFWDRMMKEVIKKHHIIGKLFPNKDTSLYKYYYQYLVDGNLSKLKIMTKIKLILGKQ